MATKKKIVFLLPNLEAGGSERVLLNYTRILNSSKYCIALIIINDFGDLLNYIPNHVKIINLNISRTRNAYFKLIKTINSIKPVYIFTTTNRTNLLLLMAKKFLIGKPKIIIREPSSPKALFKSRHLNIYYKILSQLLYKKADTIIAQTESMKKEIEKIYKVPDHKVHYVQNPIDKKHIKESSNCSLNIFNVNNINIVAAGRLRRIKGFDFLIKSFDKVLSSNDNFRLFILGKKTGTESCNEELENLIEKMNLQKYIKLLGHKTNPYPYYKNANLFVLSSRWEGMPNVVLENLYLGTPVVATRCVPVLSDLITDGKNGKLCDFGNTDELAKAILNFHSYNQEPGYICDTDQIIKLFDN